MTSDSQHRSNPKVEKTVERSVATSADISADHATAASVSDACLIRRIADGQQPALAELYDRYASRLMGIAVSILRDRGDAEDLLHDVFIEVWQDAGRFRPELSALGAWLITRVRYRAIDRIRKLEVARRHFLKERARQSEQEIVAGAQMDAEAGTLRKACRRRLAALPEGQRSVLHLMYFRGLTCQEIAVRLEVPVGTVKSRLSEGLRRLRSAFTDVLD